MQVFISWAGDLGNQIAKELASWLKKVLNGIEPFYSSDDIEKGSRWGLELTERLNNTGVGIICCTKYNLNSRWMNYEVGALSKSMNNSFVIPILFDISTVDLIGPISQFQSVSFDYHDMKKMITTINNLLINSKLNEQILDSVFEHNWSGFKTKIDDILGNYNPIANELPITPTHINEMLYELIKKMTRYSLNSSIIDGIIKDVYLLKQKIDNDTESGPDLVKYIGELMEKVEILKSANMIDR